MPPTDPRGREPTRLSSVGGTEKLAPQFLEDLCFWWFGKRELPFDRLRWPKLYDRNYDLAHELFEGMYTCDNAHMRYFS